MVMVFYKHHLYSIQFVDSVQLILTHIKEIFSQVVTFCKEMYVIGSSISIGRTKVKANASSIQRKSSDALEKEIDKIPKERIETDKYEDEINC